MLVRYEKNKVGRDWIIGDIHGHFRKVQTMLDELGFNPDVDRLFSVGDLVDRGPDSHMALEWLEKPWFHAVQGNHEDMAIRWGRPDCMMDGALYMQNGGAWNIGNTPEERAEFSHAFDALPLVIELETDDGLIGICHAGCPFSRWDTLVEACQSELTNKERKALREAVLWDRSRIENMLTDYVGGIRAIVVGHTPVDNMTSLGNHIYIDTAGWHPRGHGFTIIDAATLRPVR